MISSMSHGNALQTVSLAMGMRERYIYSPHVNCKSIRRRNYMGAKQKKLETLQQHEKGRENGSIQCVVCTYRHTQFNAEREVRFVFAHFTASLRVDAVSAHTLSAGRSS
jgi:hypothetical protein